MNAIPVHFTIIVDPCGRVLVHEVEKLLPGEEYESGREPLFRAPDYWYRNPACVAYGVTVEVPVPHAETPRITFLERRPPEPVKTFQPMEKSP
jgi:hypothetical protein